MTRSATVTPNSSAKTNNTSTFNDLMRAAEVEAIVTRSISGHLTERMQDHYSTVSGSEQRTSIAKVIALMAPAEAKHAAA